MTIKEMRVRAYMTQKEFAEYFDISRRNVENWESGKIKCADYLKKLMEYKLRKERKFVLEYYYAETNAENCVLVVDKNGKAIILNANNFDGFPLTKEVAIKELVEDIPNRLSNCETVEECLYSIGLNLEDYEIFDFDKIRDDFEVLEEI